VGLDDSIIDSSAFFSLAGIQFLLTEAMEIYQAGERVFD
jgi:hypothetical protein